MEKTISNNDISDLLTKPFTPVVEEPINHILLPPRILNALSKAN